MVKVVVQCDQLSRYLSKPSLGDAVRSIGTMAFRALKPPTTSKNSFPTREVSFVLCRLRLGQPRKPQCGKISLDVNWLETEIN
jgi:hypothetical protein